MAKSVSSNKRVIAFTGKGGVGKTVMTAIMARVLRETRPDRKLLLIDADPATGLPIALGLDVKKTIGEVREAVIHTAQNSNKQDRVGIAGMLDFLILETLVEMKGFSLLAMGRMETLGCFCPVNELLRSAIESLSKSFDIILIDCEAGLEQVHRKVVQSVDNLMIISDATLRGIQTAALINNAVQTHKIIPYGEMGLVLNRVREEAMASQLAEKAGLKILGYIPEDENITRYDLVGKPITDLPGDSPSFMAIRKVLEDTFND